MQIRPDRGWIKAGLAVLVAGSLGGGVMAATGNVMVVSIQLLPCV